MQTQPDNRTLQFVLRWRQVPSCRTAIATSQHQSMILRLLTLVFHVVPQEVLENCKTAKFWECRNAPEKIIAHRLQWLIPELQLAFDEPVPAQSKRTIQLKRQQPK